MARPGAFIPLLLLFLLPGVSPDCYMGTAEECDKTMDFVPAHSLVGEGIDVTTLEWMGVDLVDTSVWRHANGTCTLCENQWQKQRLPLAMVDWRVHISCNQELSSSVEESAMDVSQALALDVNNDWMSELQLRKESHGPALGGSKSQLTRYAYEKELQDKYTFVRQEIPCVYYRLSLAQDPPLTPHFSQALSSLPSSYFSAIYHPFLAKYGTHYVRQARLGGRVRQLTAIQTCRAVLDGLTAADIKARLDSQFLQDLGLRPLSSNAQSSNKNSQGRGSSQASYMEKRIQVKGGHSYSKQLLSTNQDASSFSTWMESLRTSPDLVSFSLMPIHTLVRPGDRRREALRQAVKEYVSERGHKKSCPRSCPKGVQADALDPCKCDCSGNPLTNSMCCSLNKGTARLKVHVRQGTDLWGDNTSGTDAYVRVIFQGQIMETGYTSGDDNPIWSKDLDFGPVVLPVKPELTMEVWDKDSWYDDLLGSCNIHLKVGSSTMLTCNLEYGSVLYFYTLECGPNLGGNNCHEYVPVRG